MRLAYHAALASGLAFHAALACGLAIVAAARGEDFPYEAFIAVDNVEIVAGPGHRFYATDRLLRGTKVEIYREEASGWLAIRPPEGSFSWVPAEFVEQLDSNHENSDHLGRVKEPTGAWIGTSVEHVSEHQQQVTLKAGELVQIVGEKSIGAKSGQDRTWLKIAPPAGEYRWVHLRDVSRQKPPERPPQVATDVEVAISEAIPISPGVSLAAVEQEHTLAPAHSQREREKRPVGTGIALRDLDERPMRFDRGVQPAQFLSPATGEPSRPQSPDGFVPRRRRTDDGAPATTSAPIRTTTTSTMSTTTLPASRSRLDSDARIATVTPRVSSSTTTSSSSAARNTSSASNSGIGGDQLAWQLDQIEVDLSLMIAQDRSQWNLPLLRRRVETLVESGADPISRGRARLMLDKIKQFEEVFDRDSRTLVGGARATSGQASNGTEKTSPTSSLADPRYDAQGWLKPVVSRKSDKPVAPYAVVDADGKPLCFVSPSPGLNLRRYENKQVGLYGRRGYLEELKKPHLMAERVIELDGGQWR
jgi:hypothetical protein